jgi:hypothetical protein
VLIFQSTISSIGVKSFSLGAFIKSVNDNVGVSKIAKNISEGCDKGDYRRMVSSTLCKELNESFGSSGGLIRQLSDRRTDQALISLFDWVMKVEIKCASADNGFERQWCTTSWMMVELQPLMVSVNILRCYATHLRIVLPHPAVPDHKQETQIKSLT